ncbi:MAG: hypothetical protein PVI35_00015 [Acidimicrobiia bacterium]
MRTMNRSMLAIAVFAMLTSCGGGDVLPNVGGGTADASQATIAEGEVAGESADALGIGGGRGTLIFDGVEHPIESVVCQVGDGVDVGTVGDGFRVLISGGEDSYSIQIVDSTPIQWFARNDLVEASGTRFTSQEDTYWNNQNDDEVEASFEIDCP